MKKKSIQAPRQLSPIEYIKTKARLLPIYKCYVNSYWIESGLTVVLVARQHKTGGFTFAYFLIDMYKRGLFKSRVYFNNSRTELDYMINTIVDKKDKNFMVVEIDYSLAHNIIYGGLEFAEQNGYSAGEKFDLSKYILEENNGKIEYIEIEFGKTELLSKENILLNEEAILSILKMKK